MEHVAETGTGVWQPTAREREFHGLWLDARMIYSCAMWGEGDTLSKAQWRSLDYQIREARATCARRALVIGGDWGTLTRAMLDDYGVERIDMVTAHETYHAAMAERPDPRLSVRLGPLRLHEPSDRYDAAIACNPGLTLAAADGTFGPPADGYAELMMHCHRWLRPGTHLIVEAIVRGFADGRAPAALARAVPAALAPPVLPTVMDLVAAVQNHFDIVTLRFDAADFARTARSWLDRLRRRRPDASRLVGEPHVAEQESALDVLGRLFEAGELQYVRLGLARFGAL